MNKKIIKKLQAIVKSQNISTEESDKKNYSHDASYHKHSLPDIVIWPENTNHVASVLRFAHEHYIPVTPYAKGTSLEGNPIPVKGGILLNMMKMNKVIEIIPKDFQVIVEPGIIGDDLNKKLQKFDIYFPSFPASSNIATIGGMIANNAGGMYAIRYGVVGNWVMELEVVLPSGIVMDLGSRSIKSVAGYNMKDLFIGSEGTLGVITKATVRLIPRIRQKILFILSFKNIENAINAVEEIVQKNLEPAAIEFLDEVSIQYLNTVKHMTWKELPTLMIEFHNKESINELKSIEKIVSNYHTDSIIKITNNEEIDNMWNLRKAIHFALMKSMPNAKLLPTDIGVPVSQIPIFIQHVKKLKEKHNILASIFGHVGDGNFHIWIIYDKENKRMRKSATSFAEEIVDIALQLNGTCTAEHGVGIGKRQFLKLEHPTSLEMMKRIKLLFDPHEIMNPRKIV